MIGAMTKTNMLKPNVEFRRTRLSRAERLLQGFQEDHHEEVVEADTQPVKAFAQLAQRMHRAKPMAWLGRGIRQGFLLSARRALRKAKIEAFGSEIEETEDLPAHHHVEMVRLRLRELANTLEPPPEVMQSLEFQELMDLLRPRGAKFNKSAFSHETGLQGKIRNDVMNRQVQEAVQEAMRLVAKKRMEQAASAEQAKNATHQIVQNLQKKIQQIKKRLKQHSSNKDEPQPTAISQEEIDELAEEALEIMRTLREEIAPRWAPEQQPWLLNAADNEVFQIVLAVVPKSLFEQTEAYEQMQNLRAHQAVFTLRAADRTSEAMGRTSKT